MNGAYRLTDDGLGRILESSFSLETLSLQQSSRLSGDFLGVLPASLVALDLSECRGISGEVLIENLSKLASLESLKLDGIQEVIYNTVLCSTCMGSDDE